MSFNVSSIKDKAISAKNATVSKIQDTRDRHTSTPMAQTKFAGDGYGLDKRKSPPPPPMRNSSTRSSILSSQRSSEDTSSRTGPPPPVVRSTKPSQGIVNSASEESHADAMSTKMTSVFERAKAFSSSAAVPTIKAPAPARPPPSVHLKAKASAQNDMSDIDWANLSREDKEEFFKWLDEFFARYLAKLRKTNEQDEDTFHVRIAVEQPPEPPVSESTIQTQAPNKPPPIKLWSKPKFENVGNDADFQMSYPPVTTHGSHALDLVYYMNPSTHWSDAWYSKDGAVPPPLVQSTQRLYKGMYMTLGDTRTLSHVGLFSDLSTAWTTVSFSLSNPSVIHSREGAYLPPPAPLPKHLLEAASVTYGETIASFAEGFLGSGSFCARGECWDLASEALKYFSQFDYVDKPVPSISRTHGHLIFCGRADGSGHQVGRWRGEDDRVRRGDIVEWRSVKINVVGAPPGSYSLLGDPEHTAIITRDSVVRCGNDRKVRDGMSVKPNALESLEVVEQSRNSPPEPKQVTYDMEAFEQGEVWIYRPISMKVYLGYDDLECEVPPNALRI